MVGKCGCIGVILATLAGGCAEEPSFRVRWRVAEPRDPDPDAPQPAPGDAPGLDSPLGCTQVGINAVRLEAYAVVEDDVEVLAGQRTRPCYPFGFDDPDATARGFPLAAGEYRFKLRGVRRDGASWSADDEEATFVFPEPVEIEDGRTIRLLDGDEDPEIPAPPQCEDGVDNDGDGFVDTSDPSCQAAGADLEGRQILPKQFQLRASFLDHNPNVVSTAHCQGLGVDDIRVYDPNNPVCSDPNIPDDPPPACTAQDGGATRDDCCLAVINCTDAVTQLNFFSVTATESLQTVAVVATAKILQEDEGGTPLDPLWGVPVTHVELVPVSERGATKIEVDFADADFLSPIQSKAELPFQLFPEGQNLSLCQRSGGVGVAIADLVFQSFDAHGGPLATPVQIQDPSPGPMDGATALACRSSVFRTESLTWGGYLVTAQARSATGEVCFEVTEPFALAPGTEAGFLPDDGRGLFQFERVIPPPPSCLDCMDDADCGALFCQDQICIECRDDSDCPDGQTCRDAACEDF